MTGGKRAFDRGTNVGADGHDRSAYDFSRAAMARLWNLWGGGKNYDLADRTLGETVAAHFPQIESLARHRLTFRSRAVRTLVGEYGIDQVLVAGVDMPMRDEVHAIAHSINPRAQVVYADADELAMLYASIFFTGDADTCGFVSAGLEDPRAMLDGAAASLDFDRPIAVLLINSLDVLDDPQAVVALSALREALAAGSHIAFCHLTAEHDRELAVLGSMCADARPGPPRVRSPAGLEAFCTDLMMIEPGLVAAPSWRPEPSPWPVPTEVDLWCGVGVLP
ncbi:SAM-dependent methyltransferase [Actinomadura sp. KC216]|uniref:SAM-dependent methyltransferase n=1 Tax=Actinomadura sp. KC216 TaxID=2530370 RepID=UPI001053BCC7|nr:SAM-dependent methyltransferase [Actinomadura sp. KC216]TDB88839.1 SAM-dependent methyltransferase [Actinomadura sp. KC216]